MSEPDHIRRARERAREHTRRDGRKVDPPADEWPEGQRGDAWEPPQNGEPDPERNGEPEPERQEQATEHAPAAYPWPDPPAAEVYHGLGGEVVRAIEPQSEADPVALPSQFLVALGNPIGRTA